jgi:hypothetical protein
MKPFDGDEMRQLAASAAARAASGHSAGERLR